MIIVDSSVWIAHLKKMNTGLVNLLQDNNLLIHPFIIGELACGSMKNREEFLTLLSLLPTCSQASHDEVMGFIDKEKIYGKGIGWVDANLLVSARLSKGKIWTLDKRLQALCVKFHLSVTAP
ncbi:MAG: type II toxin-antitoxin system VapC family toxin [Oligoflexales bacterium]|nr:type II toxin-antitoxin system VapC family toxin [Oligoflexales bacterium]